MAIIRFLRDFQGVNTNFQFYSAGEIVDIPTGDAVVAEGAAEYVPFDVLVIEPTELSEGEAAPPVSPSESVVLEPRKQRVPRKSRKEP